MMGKNKNTNATDTKMKIGTVIGEGAVFDGNFTSPETMRMDGTLNGNCTCEKLLIIGAKGKIIGNITAQNLIISGQVEGDIDARGKLELLSTGKITGNITAKSLVIDENAFFDGKCTMTTPGTKDASDKSAANASGKDKKN